MLLYKLNRLVYSGPDTRLNRDKGSKWRHIALGIPHVEIIDFIGAGSIFRFRLQVHLPLATEAIELVDVGATKESLQRLIDLAEL